MFSPTTSPVATLSAPADDIGYVPPPGSPVEPEAAPTIFSVSENLTKADILVYICLSEIGTDLTQADIAFEVDISERQAGRSVANLADSQVITITKVGRRNTYTLPNRDSVERPAKAATSPPAIAETKTTNPTPKSLEPAPDQLALIGDQDQQNLGALDIRPHLVQDFPKAPQACKHSTPAQILATHPDAAKISANLQVWRDALDSGQLNVSDPYVSPALIWVRIFEDKAPRLFDDHVIDHESPSEPLRSTETPFEYDEPSVARERGDEPQEAVSEDQKSPSIQDSKADSKPDSCCPVSAPCTNTNTTYTHILKKQDKKIDDKQIQLEEIWQAVLKRLQGQVQRSLFDSRFKGTRLLSLEDGHLVIDAGTALNRDWLEHQLKPKLLRAVAAQIGYAVTLELVVSG